MGGKVWTIRFCWTIHWDVAGIYWRRWRRVRFKNDNLGGRTSCTVHHILAWACKGNWQPVPNESLCNSVWWLVHVLGDSGLFSGQHFFLRSVILDLHITWNKIPKYCILHFQLSPAFLRYWHVQMNDDGAWAVKLSICGCIPSGRKRFCSPKHSDWLRDPPTSHSVGLFSHA